MTVKLRLKSCGLVWRAGVPDEESGCSRAGVARRSRENGNLVGTLEVVIVTGGILVQLIYISKLDPMSYLPNA